jgi:uncharacterized protein
MSIVFLDPARYTRVPWKNGGGVSVTIASERVPGTAPDDWSGVIWQLGRTAIVVPGPFSDLSGYERLQTVTAGTGLVLQTPEGEIDLRRPFTVARYDGGTPITSQLDNGPVSVVNLIGRRDRVRIDMHVLGAGERCEAPAGAILYCPPGTAASGMANGDAFTLEADEAAVADRTINLLVANGTLLVATTSALF